MKKSFKAFAAALLALALVMSATLTAFGNDGIRVVIDGLEWQFDEDMTPFVHDGRVFLPIRGIADVFGIPIEWEQDTNTVHVGWHLFDTGRDQDADSLLRIAHYTLPWSFDPIDAHVSVNAMGVRQIFDTLVVMDHDTMTVMPSLAAEWHMPDPRTVEISLRQDVYFHDGYSLTAHDVQYSLHRAAAAEQLDVFLGMISHVEVHDWYELTIHLAHDFAPIIYHLAHPTASIVPAYYHEMYLEWGMATGTGPFMLMNFWSGDSAIWMDTNFRYWGNVPQFDMLRFESFSHSIDAVIYGWADIALDVHPLDMEWVRELDDITMLVDLSMSFDYIGINTAMSPWDNPAAVRAVSYAIDIESIFDSIFEEAFAPTVSPLARRLSGYTGLPPFEVDLDRAAELLAQAGLSDGFGITIAYNTHSSFRGLVAEHVARDLAQIGIEAKIISLEWPEFLDATARGEFDIYVLGWNNPLLNKDYGLFYLFHSSAHGHAGNRTFHNNPQVDALLDAARAEIDSEARAVLYNQVLQLLRENPTVLPLGQGQYRIGISGRVAGFVPNPAGYHRFADVHFTE